MVLECESVIWLSEVMGKVKWYVRLEYLNIDVKLFFQQIFSAHIIHLDYTLNFAAVVQITLVLCYLGGGRFE